MSVHRVVIVGGGIAALEGALALQALAGDRVETVVASPRTGFSFPAMQVREPFGGPAALQLPLAEILDGVARCVQTTVSAVDAEGGRVLHTAGDPIAYDSLLLCLGGTPFPAFAHGITFDRPNDPESFDALVDDVAERFVQEVAFVVPDAAGWTLPAYDLALLLRSWADRSARSLTIRIVTAESMVLEAFGSAVSARVGAILAEAGIEVACGAEPVLISDAALVVGGHWMTPDRIVSLPRLAGPRLPGVPCNTDGFIEVDADGHVPGASHVFAAGDGAAHRRKQGGLAAQQADRAVRALLHEIGVAVPAIPGTPLLQGVLATPEGPLFLQAGVGYGSANSGSVASLQPLWDPPSKVATRWLGPHLAELVIRRSAAFAA